MARIKAIFDADILIHLIKTNSIEFAIETIDVLYVSEYVYQNEIKKDTGEGKSLEKIKNKGKIKLLSYGGLTEPQKIVYRETYNLLKKEDISDNPEKNPINEGERTSACFAKACNIYYYMSDDNRAAPYIRSLAAIETVNYCDILYLHMRAYGKNKVAQLKLAYETFIELYDEGKIPRILKNRGVVHTFSKAMEVTYDKFKQSPNLTRLLDNVIKNVEENNKAK